MFAVIGFRGRSAAISSVAAASRAPTAASPLAAASAAVTSALSSSSSSSSSASTHSPFSGFTQKRHFNLRSKDADLVIPGTIKLKPRTPGTRHARVPDLSQLYTGPPVEHLTKRLVNHGGRNALGRIAVRGRGGDGKRIYRVIDFKRQKVDSAATVERLEFDPNRSANIALVRYPDGEQSYILAPDGLAEGDTVMSSKTKELELLPGNTMPLKLIPVGKTVHCVENVPGRGGAYARSAGTYMVIQEKNVKNKYVQVEMNSKEQRLLHENCMATIGRVSFPNHQFLILGKAGARRKMGRRPKVRGVAMNAVDHPHGGGEGKSKGGRPSMSKWGKHTKGMRTRNKHHHNNKFRIRRRPMNKKRYQTDEADVQLTSAERSKAEMLSQQKGKKGGKAPASKKK